MSLQLAFLWWSTKHPRYLAGQDNTSNSGSHFVFCSKSVHSIDMPSSLNNPFTWSTLQQSLVSLCVCTADCWYGQFIHHNEPSRLISELLCQLSKLDQTVKPPMSETVWWTQEITHCLSFYSFSHIPSWPVSLPSNPPIPWPPQIHFFFLCLQKGAGLPRILAKCGIKVTKRLGTNPPIKAGWGNPVGGKGS